jgi:hypothetical protein
MLNILQAERSQKKDENVQVSASRRGMQLRRHKHKVWFNFFKS